MGRGRGLSGSERGSRSGRGSTRKQGCRHGLETSEPQQAVPIPPAGWGLLVTATTAAAAAAAPAAAEQTKADEGCGAVRTLKQAAPTSMNRSVAAGSLRRGMVGPASSRLRGADKGKLWSARFVVRDVGRNWRVADSTESKVGDWATPQVSSKAVSRCIPVRVRPCFARSASLLQ
ncbi:hypothetical protein CORC01_09183 [Colletotrichum orchidophilum]|uniref:Uncharacterized protein n=1 Tax=Colletotrichum orchidophilum TaxID=1209926 RepID=A0A1G4B2N0_9PEZI|nr:uncharacterized protein CORC01_09183 [Colletotrichum orchidophilum]OHE95593.1 hypothetical protein CORC01_09183 [Colletotrichum orchidophilum]